MSPDIQPVDVVDGRIVCQWCREDLASAAVPPGADQALQAGIEIGQAITRHVCNARSLASLRAFRQAAKEALGGKA
jgi:hypothetical protein